MKYKHEIQSCNPNLNYEAINLNLTPKHEVETLKSRNLSLARNGNHKSSPEIEIAKLDLESTPEV